MQQEAAAQLLQGQLCPDWGMRGQTGERKDHSVAWAYLPANV